LERAVHQLLDAMPSEIRVPHDVVAGSKRKPLAPRGNMVPKKALADRDAVIVERSASESVQEIALELGLSERTVQRVLEAA
jgi:DNA-binding NarL/FixJ family response regulator